MNLLIKSIKNFRKDIKYYFISSVLLIILVFIVIPEPLFVKSDYSTVILDENNKILRIFLNKDEQWYFPPDKTIEVPEKLETAIISFEDRYFYYHPGINPVSIINAFISNLSEGRIVRGGSTITMQLVRISSPQKRNYFNKIREIFKAIKVEIWYSKKDILRMYVDNAPYGGNIIGYQAASLKYFKKKPEHLTWSEACTLAVLPNSPGIITPVKKNKLLVNKRNFLLKILFEQKVINSETYKLSLLEPVPQNIAYVEPAAPHLSQILKNRLSEKSKIIRSSIIKELQLDIEGIVKNHIKYLNTKGIKNGSVLVADTETGKIRAYVGSQDFFDKKNNGEVDGVISPRSTGSVLKPFLYALCIDEGYILPQTKIKDVPTFFGSFSPENSDKKYNGIISADEALIRSLNVPAVRLLDLYGVYNFYSFLKEAGITSLFRKPDDYGLTLIIGGAETSLYQLAMLYRGIGNYGKFSSLTIVQDENQDLAEKQLISPGASYLVLNILKDLKRPDTEYYWQQYENQFKIAWKTGTSFGNRDAWAVGVSPQWTVAVWIGNFTGEGNPNLAGAISAGSLMFDIFNYLPRDKTKLWFEKPYEFLKLTEICRDTGYRAGEFCPAKKMVEIPVNMKPLKICPFHKNIFVAADEKIQVCSLCWKPGNYKKKYVLNFSPDIVQYLRERGQNIFELPPHNPNCTGFKSRKTLQIIYPEPKAKIFLPRDIDGKLQKLNIKLAHNKKKSIVYWYIDNKYYGSTKDLHSKSFTLDKGVHTLEVIDETGFREKREFFIDLKK